MFYKKTINGRTVCTNGKAVKIDGKWVKEPTEEMLLADGWEPYTPEVSLSRQKARKCADAVKYAESLKMVKLFGKDVWKTPAERDNYLSTLQSAQRMGQTSINFLGLDMTIEQGIHIIDVVNVWAFQVTATKERHEANIMALETADEVKSYDYTVGYPEQLVIGLGDE